MSETDEESPQSCKGNVEDANNEKMVEEENPATWKDLVSKHVPS